MSSVYMCFCVPLAHHFLSIFCTAKKKKTHIREPTTPIKSFYVHLIFHRDKWLISAMSAKYFTNSYYYSGKDCCACISLTFILTSNQAEKKIWNDMNDTR